MTLNQIESKLMRDLLGWSTICCIGFFFFFFLHTILHIRTAGDSTIKNGAGVNGSHLWFKMLLKVHNLSKTAVLTHPHNLWYLSSTILTFFSVFPAAAAGVGTMCEQLNVVMLELCEWVKRRWYDTRYIIQRDYCLLHWTRLWSCWPASGLKENKGSVKAGE